jgi:hypothetical protein
MTRKSVVSGLLPAALGQYSRAIVAGGFVFCSGTAGIDPVPLEYSIERATWAITSGHDAVMVGWPGAAQDRLPADVPAPRCGCPGVPRRPGEVR